MNEKLIEALSKVTDALNKLSEEVTDLTLEICRSNLNKDTPSIEDVKEVAPTTEKSAPAVDEHKYTFEEVRGLMATLSSSGKKVQAKALLSSLNVTRLSEVKESDFATLATKAKELING